VSSQPRERRLKRPLQPPVAAAHRVTIYTDGACTGNPGPGGWAAIIIDGSRRRELSGAVPASTNQRMELTAVIEGLRALDGRRRATVHSDSAYVVNCFHDRWYVRWRQNGWMNAQKKPVDNRDLWEVLIGLAERHDVAWRKVAAHSGVPLNERADRLAREAIDSMRAGGSGPRQDRPPPATGGKGETVR